MFVWARRSVASHKELHLTVCVPATFSSNPQFVVRLEDVDDDPLDGEDGCTFLVGLMQKDVRRHKRLDRNLETIGFAIFEVSESFDILYEIYGRPFSLVKEKISSRWIMRFLKGQNFNFLSHNFCLLSFYLTSYLIILIFFS